MNDVEVIKVIEKYLNKSIYSYAVLIDGEWGSGKTYFVKNILMPHISNTIISSKSIKFVPLYISLYGISTIEEISNQLYIQILPKVKDKTLKKLSNLGLKVVSDVFKTKEISTKGITEALKSFVNFEKYVLIFDDLERCSLNVNEVLGYINNFVEHDGIKTIIVTNQNEMGKISASNNLELKYLLATNENIKIEESGQADNNKDEKLDMHRIKKRTEFIFSENILYRQIKEKIIGITIQYKADIPNIIDNIMSKVITNKDLYKIAVENKDFLITTTSDLQHENLRTIQFALERFSELGDIIWNIECDKYKEQIIKEVFCYTIYSATKFKKEDYLYEWQGENKIGNIIVDNKKNKVLFGFKFVDKSISKSIVSTEEVTNIIKKYVQLLKEKDNKEYPLTGLENYLELEDEEIIKELKAIDDKLRSNNININLYPKIITKLINIKNMGFGVEYLERSIEHMKLNIELKTSYLKFDEYDNIIHDEKVLHEYKEYIKPLNEMLNERRNKSNVDKLNSFFHNGSEENWGNEFYSYCWLNAGLFKSNMAFFSTMDINKVVECLMQSKQRNVYMFRNSVIEVYDFSNIEDYFSNDYSNIIDLNDRLSDELVNIKSISKKYSIQVLLETLSKYMNILKKNI
jgi:hypothetical protein